MATAMNNKNGTTREMNGDFNYDFFLTLVFDFKT